MTVLVGMLVGLAAWVGLRDRAWKGTAALLGASAVLCGAGPDESVTVKGGVSGGRYVEICGPAHNYSTGAIDVEYRRALAESLDVTVAGQLHVVVDQARPDEVGEPWTKLGVGFAPRIGLDQTWVGGSVGVVTGALLIQGDRGPLFPTATLRIGPRSAFFFDAAVGDHFAGGLPAGWLRFGLGVGLPPKLHTDWNHPVLKLGLADSGGYGWVEIPIGQDSMVDVFGSYGDEQTWRVALGARWRWQ